MTAAQVETMERSVLSPADRKRGSVRSGFGTLQVVVLVALVVIGLGPLLWVAKAALSSSQSTLQAPLAFFPSGGVRWGNLSHAWFDNHIGLYIVNSVLLAVGCVITNVVVSICTSYVLSVLKPRWAPVLSGAILATLFIPAVVLLVPLYLTVLDLPLVHVDLQNTYWAIWLVAAANPFNVLVVKRFFDAIPADLFEAARIDGAGPWRVLFSVVIPLCRPIIAVIACCRPSPPGKTSSGR